MSLEQYCHTEKERAYTKAFEKHGPQWTMIAKMFDKNESTVRITVGRVRARASIQGFSPDDDMVHTAPETHVVKGVSTLYDDVGGVKQQWVKTDLKKEALGVALEAFVSAFKEDMPRIIPSDYTGTVKETDIVPWFNIGDAHIGALAHGIESGNDNDIYSTEEEIIAAMYSLIDDTRPTERCVIYDCGDMTHYETFDGITMGHGHKLDCDSTYSSMIQSYSRVMRAIIIHALRKFKYVDVIINQGNHSRSNDIFMRELLCCYFEHEERVHVLDNSNVFIPYRMGNTFVLCHHGDKTKHSKLSGVMATDYAKDWGESVYRYIWTGHIHHREVLAKEEAGVMIESWNTMSKGDKYAHDNGWRSRKCLSVVELSKTYGEVGRRTIPIEKVQDIVNFLQPGETAAQRKGEGVYSV